MPHGVLVAPHFLENTRCRRDLVRALTIIIALSLQVPLATGCAFSWRKIGDKLAPDVNLARRSEVHVLRSEGGPKRHDGLDLAFKDGWFKKIYTAMGLDACEVQLRVRVKNVGTTENSRMRGAPLTLVDAEERSHSLSGPYGCDDGSLDPGQECLATFTARIAPSQCATPSALVLGSARLPLSL